MAMVGSALSTVIKAAIASIPENERSHDAIWDAIGDALVTFIQTNATVAVISVSGVTTGIGVSGPGAGTIS